MSVSHCPSSSPLCGSHGTTDAHEALPFVTGTDDAFVCACASMLPVDQGSKERSRTSQSHERFIFLGGVLSRGQDADTNPNSLTQRVKNNRAATIHTARANSSGTTAPALDALPFLLTPTAVLWCSYRVCVCSAHQ